MSELSALLEEFEHIGDGFSARARPMLSFGKQDKDGFIDVSALLSPGVYALLQGDTIIYIGRAKILVNRIYTHFLLMRRKQAGKPLPMNGPSSRAHAYIFSGCKIWTCNESDLYRFEKEMIAKYRPKYNILDVPKGKVTFEQIGYNLTRFGITSMAATPIYRRRL